MSFFGLRSQNYTVGFYNVENLFDTIQNLDDKEYFPDGTLNWNIEKYNDKLNKINQVIDSIGNPLIFGFAEVENKQVLVDLLNGKHSHSLNAVVHQDSKDLRGIDVGLVYDSSKLKLLKQASLFIPLADGKLTRDILAAQFIYKNDTIWTFVNHWPSRREGQLESEPKRIAAAKTLLHFVDSLQKNTPLSRIIVLGDLNDHPNDRSVMMITKHLKPMISAQSGLYAGTHHYKDEWGILDHIFINDNHKKSKFSILSKQGVIFSKDFILETYKGKKVPFRTYVGKKYLGGYADHLPVYINIKLK